MGCATVSCLLVHSSGNPSSGGAAHDCLRGAVGRAEMVSFGYLFWIVLLSAVAVQRPNMMSASRLLSFLRKKGMDLVCECLCVCVCTCLCVCVCAHASVCVHAIRHMSTVGRCCGSSFRSGLNSPAQTLTGPEGLQSALWPRSSPHNSQQTHSRLGPRPWPKFPRFPAGR